MLMGVSSSDGSASQPVYVNPVTHAVLVTGSSDTLTPTIGTKIARDGNRVPVGRGVKSSDPTVPFPFYADPSNHRLLVSNA